MFARLLPFSFAVLCSSLFLGAEPKVFRVFLLAGQSNMEGQGVVDLDHPKYYNGGKGILERVMADPTQAKRYVHLKTPEGAVC